VTDPSRSGPAVRYPPPLLFVLGIVVGWLLDGTLPLPLASPGTRWARLVGWLLVALGAGLAAWALTTFRRARTTFIPNRPASMLVTHGPYRLSRNPMYLALCLLCAGAAFLVNTAWILLLLPVVIAVLQRTVIRPEERYLDTTFVSAYDRYRRSVRRWL
jgi:protein-S-isoprenylcysteine O-methyltransferase Ste14